MVIHGCKGWDFSFGNPEKIDQMLDRMIETGLTGVVTTLITTSEEQRLPAAVELPLQDSLDYPFCRFKGGRSLVRVERQLKGQRV